MLLFESDFFHVELREGYIHSVRTEAGFETPEQIQDEHKRFIEAISGRASAALFDLRRAKGRNDARFEAAITRWRKPMLGGFQPAVILVQSAVGKLQVQRHMNQDGLHHVVVTIDEEEAIAIARGKRVAPGDQKTHGSKAP